MADNKHDNYEILNLIGYGMAKFGMEFVREFGLQTKTTFYEYIIRCGVAEISLNLDQKSLLESLHASSQRVANSAKSGGVASGMVG